MDELNMEALELPDLDGLDYQDPPDASDAFEEKEEVSDVIFDDSTDDYDISSVSMDMISEMDGSSFGSFNPEPKEEPKPASAVSAEPMLEPMYDAPPKAAAERAPSSGTYNSSGTTGSYSSYSGSYQSSQSSSPRISSNMDDLYRTLNTANTEKYEKGKKKTRLVAGAGIAVYGFNTFIYLMSLLSYFSISTLIDLGFAACLLYMFIQFFRGSGMAKDTLGYIVGIHMVKNIIGLVGAGALTVGLSAIGLGAIGGFTLVTGIISLVIRGVLIYFLILDEDVSEYTKGR